MALTTAQQEKIIALGKDRAALLIRDQGSWSATPTPAFDGPDVPGSDTWTDDDLRDARALYSATVRDHGGLGAMEQAEPLLTWAQRPPLSETDAEAIVRGDLGTREA